MFSLTISIALSSSLEFTKVFTFANNGETPNKINCVDSSNCVMLTDHGGYCKIYHSMDGGLNWNTIINNYKTDLIRGSAIAYPKKNNIFVLYDSYLIIKYSDTGKTLDSMKLNIAPDNKPIAFTSRKLEMIDTLVGIACINNIMVVTYNGWKSHKIIDPDLQNGSDITSVCIQDKNNFFAINTQSFLYRTTNGGITFSKYQLESEGNIIYFLDKKNGYILGSKKLIDIPLSSKPLLFKTNDSGENWVKILDTIIEPRNSGGGQIDMYNEFIGTFVETRGTVITTENGFKSFDRIYIDGVSKNASAGFLSIAYSGNRPIIAASNVGIFTTIPDTILINMPIPELIEPPDKSTTMTSEINFKWKNAEGIFQYVFHLSSNADFSDTMRLDTLEHNPLHTEFQEYFLNDLVACTEYYWKVASLKEGRVKWSVPFSFNTGKIPVTKVFPSNNATEIEYDTDVNWKELNGAERYHLQCSYDNGFNDLFYSQDTLTETKHLLENLPEDKEIFWRVRGYCKDGFADWSEVWKFRTKKSTGVRYSEDFKGIVVSPNPAGDYIVISIPEINPTVNRRVDELVDKIRIFNTLGIDLTPDLSINGEEVRIDVSHLPAGVYFVKIDGMVEKFVKM
jgi:photosystem II stability/assembly factor-like uncharacterized protein